MLIIHFLVITLVEVLKDQAKFFFNENVKLEGEQY